MTEALAHGDDALAGSLAARLDAESQRKLGRSLAVLVAHAADCGACVLELAALRTLRTDLARLGITLVDTPAAADVLLVSGAMTRTLVAPFRLAYAAMARPKWVVAVGHCATDGGPVAKAGPVAGGTDAAIPVDLVIPGCPPTPDAVLAGLCTILAANL